MKQDQVLTGWHSGKWPGGTYGLRFGQLREVLIDGKPKGIELLLEGESAIEATISPGFWEHCPEVRDSRIGDWMKKQGVSMPWPKGRPPRFPVARIGNNVFRVRKPIR